MVYLEVVPRTTSSGGKQILEGQECLVFFAGGVPSARSRHPGGVNAVLCDGSVRFVRDENELVAALTRTSLLLPASMIVGPGTQIGYATTQWQLTTASRQAPSLGLTSNGGQAVLIAMLLPAVQAALEAATRKTTGPAAIEKLKAMTGVGGHVFILGSQGELLPY